MRTRIKICCITSAHEAQLAIAAGADALGLVGPMPSGPGVIPEGDIAAIAAAVPPAVTAFLLTSATSAEVIAAQALAAGVGTVQIVSHIPPAESAALARRLPGVRRVQVIHVEDAQAPEVIDVYAPHVHAFLLDSGRPGMAVPELGGTGRVHDWAVSAEFVRRSPRPVFLAGGLSPDNVVDAIRTVRPFGLDVCSGVRTHGALDAGKLERFVRAVSAA